MYVCIYVYTRCTENKLFELTWKKKNDGILTLEGFDGSECEREWQWQATKYTSCKSPANRERKRVAVPQISIGSKSQSHWQFGYTHTHLSSLFSKKTNVCLVERKNQHNTTHNTGTTRIATISSVGRNISQKSNTHPRPTNPHNNL